jgi:outer membrane protein
MSTTVRRVWLTILLTAAPSLASAQAPLSLTLEEAITRAVEQAPKLADARAREAAAAATVQSRAALGSPTVMATSAYLRTNHVDEFGVAQPSGRVGIIFPDIPNNFDVRTELKVPLYTAGRVSTSVDAARADSRATGDDRRVTEQDVRLEVVRAYWTLVTGRRGVTVLEQSLQRMDAYVGDVRARVDAGVLPPNDLLSAQAQRAHENVQLIQARNIAALAEVDLARLIGAPLGQPIATVTPVEQPLPAAIEAAGQPIDALVTRALGGRAERTGLQDRQAALRASAAAALAGTRPQVGLLGAVEPARPNPRFVPRMDQWRLSWDLGVNLSWPVWDGGRAKADHAASMAQADAVGHRVEDFDALVAVEVRQRVLDLQSDQAALEAAIEGVAAATEARRVVGERFTAGVATSTDVLDAQQDLVQSELERTRFAAAVRLDEARLLRALGAL